MTLGDVVDLPIITSLWSGSMDGVLHPEYVHAHARTHVRARTHARTRTHAHAHARTHAHAATA
jgi:hypothetical protein